MPKISEQEWKAITSGYPLFEELPQISQLLNELQAVVMMYCHSVLQYGLRAEHVHAAFRAIIDNHILQRCGPDREKFEEFIQKEMAAEADMPVTLIPYDVDVTTDAENQLVAVLNKVLEWQLNERSEYDSFIDSLDLGALVRGDEDGEVH